MKERNYYKIACITTIVVFLSIMVWNGMPATLDDIATWRNDGFPTEDARCAKAFDIEVMK